MDLKPNHSEGMSDKCCPQCSQPLAKVGQFWICPQHGQISFEKPFAPKRLFLSYGHDEHVSLALRLRDDLKARGHNVWFDEERLQPGHDWEAFIEQGLEHLAADKANSAVVLLLTPHAVRRPDGYCLNEVARALGRGLSIIPLMVVESEPPLSICRIQWLDMRKCIPIHEKEAFYKPRFERLLKAIEEHQLDFEGNQRRLIKALQPLEFEADLLRHVPKFTGRRWVFDALQSWLAEDPPRQRVFWISGEPGVGKTALSAVLSSRYLEVAALHLCKFGHTQKSDPRRVVTSLAYQLSTQLPDYEARLAALDVERLSQDEARTMFDNLLVQPLATLSQPTRPIVVLIDALDEATSNERNVLASFIAEEFPKTPRWLRLIITSRPERAVTVPLQGLNPFILDTETEANRADIRDYLERELEPLLQGHADAEHVVKQIVEKSEGVFLYVERVCHDLQHGLLSLDRLEEFPQGLGGAFWQSFERQFPDLEKFRKDIRPALRAILAAREPLPVVILQRLFSWQDEELRDFTRTLGSLVPVMPEGDSGVIRPYHKALADWLADEAKAGPYFVSVSEGHRLLGDLCLLEWKHGPLFAIREVVYHLQFDANPEKLLSVLLTPAYYERKRTECGPGALLEDLNFFSVRPLDKSAQVTLDECLPEVKAIFSIAALIVFSSGVRNSWSEVRASLEVLCRFVEGGCDPQLLEIEREKLAPRISSAKRAPRLEREERYRNPFAANTLHYFEDYVENWLEAEDAAFALQPARMISCMSTALKNYAIYSCDGDPGGAIKLAIEETAEDFSAKLPILTGLALRLNAGIVMLRESKSIFT